MRTAMQELQKILINKIIKKENGRLNDLQEGFNNGLRFALEHIENAFEKEKEQIQKAFSDGQETPINHPTLPHYSREEYYNHNYNQDK